MIEDYDQWRIETWKGEDWFVRPDMRQDITGDDFTALKYFSDWLGASNKNQLVILGDVGSGKSTLVRFLVYDLARNYLKDPVRHPAPVLIPLGEVRKETSLEGVIHEHFSRRNLPVANFRRFEHLVRLGKIILFFDAFDEMATASVSRTASTISARSAAPPKPQARSSSPAASLTSKTWKNSAR